MDLSDELRVILFTFLVGLVLIVGLIYMLLKPMDKYSFTVGLLKLACVFGNLYDGVVNDSRVVDSCCCKLNLSKQVHLM